MKFTEGKIRQPFALVDQEGSFSLVDIDIIKEWNHGVSWQEQSPGFKSLIYL